MPGPDPNVTYRKPGEVALQLVDQLRQAWSGLPAKARVELGGLLEQVRVQLVQAAGDASSDISTAVFQGDRLRAVALNRFLAGCESSVTVPVELKAGLGKAHTGGESIPKITKQEARKIVAAIDLVVSPPRASDGGPLVTPPENFTDPLGRAQKLTKWFVQHWEAISIETENAVADAMIRLGQALESAQSDSDSEAAAQEFLRAIKASASAYEQVASSVVYRSLGGGKGSGAGAENVQRILATLQRHPTVGPALQAEDRSAKPAPLPIQPAEFLSFGVPGSEADTEAAPSDTAVSFHTAVDFPAEVTVFDKRIPLIVQLTLDTPPDTQVDATVTVEFTTPEAVEQVLVVCDAQGFEHEKDVNTRLIEVYKSSDSQLAVFLLTPQKDVEPGAKRISLDFYHRGRPAGNAVFETLIKDRPPLEKPNEKASPVTLFGIEQRLILETPVADAPDFVLRVTLGVDAQRDAKRLSFMLDSPKGLLGYRHKPVGEVTLADDPRHFLETKIMDLSMKARKSVKDRQAGETESFQQDIAQLGWYLYDQLFPQQLKEEWPKILAKGDPGSLSLLLISDEPWIPWEIVNTPDKDGAFPLDGFLCQQFRMTRWLAGPGLPDQLTLDTIQLIAPEKTNLASVKREKKFFATLSAETPDIRVIKNPLETSDQVRQAMRQQLARLYHFACHGEFEPGDPDSSGLLLAGGPFSPSDIVGPTLEGIKNSRPMIFLNACSSAEADFGLSRIGGWAQRFVSAGATAFIGSLWEVNDILAAEFAVAFYGQILAGKALGEAFYQARQIIKHMDPANPTWLAYVLYAHPNGKVEIGA